MAGESLGKIVRGPSEKCVLELNSVGEGGPEYSDQVSGGGHNFFLGLPPP